MRQNKLRYREKEGGTTGAYYGCALMLQQRGLIDPNYVYAWYELSDAEMPQQYSWSRKAGTQVPGVKYSLLMY